MNARCPECGRKCEPVEFVSDKDESVSGYISSCCATPLPDGRTVFKVGNIYFTDIGTCAEYAEAHGTDMIALAELVYVRYGVARERNFLLGSAM